MFKFVQSSENDYLKQKNSFKDNLRVYSFSKFSFQNNLGIFARKNTFFLNYTFKPIKSNRIKKRKPPLPINGLVPVENRKTLNKFCIDSP